MSNCFICNSIINKLNGRHLYHCAKINGITTHKNELKFLNIQHNTNVSITKEEIYNFYINLEYSISDLSKHYIISVTDCAFILDYFNIPRRNLKAANSTKKRSKDFKETCLKKYGVDNPSKHTDIQRKKEETFFKNYGVSNIFSVEGIRDIFHNTMLERYGTGSVTNKNGYNHADWWNSLSIDEQEKRVLKMNLGWTKFWNNLENNEKAKIIKKRKLTLSDNIRSGKISPVYSTSSLEVRINKVLQENSISFTWQKWITNKAYDFHILNSNIILEINGDYWHANPMIYQENDLIQYPCIKKYAKEVWESDKIKKELAESYGYNVLYIWESDIIKLDDEQLSDLVMRILNENKEY